MIDLKYSTKTSTILYLKNEINSLSQYLSIHLPPSFLDFNSFINLFQPLLAYQSCINNSEDLLKFVTTNSQTAFLKEFFTFLKGSVEQKKNNHYYQKRLLDSFLSNLNQSKTIIYKPNFHLENFNKKWDLKKNPVSHTNMLNYLDAYIQDVFLNNFQPKLETILNSPQTHFISNYTENKLGVYENELIFKMISERSFSTFFSKLHSIRYLSLHYSRNTIELYTLLPQYNNFTHKDISKLNYVEYSIFRYYYHYHSINSYLQHLKSFLHLYEKDMLNLHFKNYHFESLSDTMTNNLQNDNGLTLPIDSKKMLVLKTNNSSVDTQPIPLQHFCLFQDFLLFDKNKWHTLKNEKFFPELLKINLLRSIFSSSHIGYVDINDPNCLNLIISNLSSLSKSVISKLLLNQTILHRFKKLAADYAYQDSILKKPIY